MAKVIKHWEVKLRTKEMVDYNLPSEVVGIQLDPEPEFNNGFLITRKGNALGAINAGDISSFIIEPIYEE